MNVLASICWLALLAVQGGAYASKVQLNKSEAIRPTVENNTTPASVFTTCPTGYFLSNGICHNEEYVLIRYDLDRLRKEGNLDLTVSYKNPQGNFNDLVPLGYDLSLPATKVAYQGKGIYQAKISDVDPWWKNSPLILTRSRNLADINAERSTTSVLGNSYQDMGWGIWQNAVARNKGIQRANAIAAEGKPLLGYLEGTGNIFVFLAAVDRPTTKLKDSDLTRIRYTHWNWGAWDNLSLPPGMQWLWVGAHTYFNDTEAARPFTRTHDKYGLPAPVDQQRMPISSGSGKDPRTEPLYRMCATLNLNGDLDVEYRYRRESDNPKLPGVIPHRGKYYSLIAMHRDLACQIWRDYHDISLRYLIDSGADGVWMDNVSLFDSWGVNPSRHAFGAHSVAGFLDWLSKYAPANWIDRSDLKVHIKNDTLNFPCVIKQKVRTNFGERPKRARTCTKRIKLSHPLLKSSRWETDLSWRAYQAYQASLAIDYYRNFRNRMDTLDPDFLWGVNDLPSFGGIVGGEVPPDMNMSEFSTGTHFSTGPRAVGIPPTGSLAPYYDLASRFDRSQFQSLFFYVKQKSLQDSFDLHRALAAEAISFDTFLMPSAGDVRAPGTTQSASSIHAWLTPIAEELRGRRSWSKTAIVFSPDSWLIAFRPGGVDKKTKLEHANSFAGWYHALRKANLQPEPLISTRLNRIALDQYSTIVLPNVQVLSTDAITRLTLWVEQGGTLITSGKSGRYRGRTELYEPYDIVKVAGLAHLTGNADLAALRVMTEVSRNEGRVFSVPGAPGGNAWLSKDFRPISAIITNLTRKHSFHPLIAKAPDGEFVDVRLHIDSPRGRLFIDFVNRGYDKIADRLPSAGIQNVDLELPDFLLGIPLESRVAGGHGTASIKTTGNLLSVSTNNLEDIISVIVESAAP